MLFHFVSPTGPKKRRLDEEEEEDIEPVVTFALSSCENIHACLQLPSSLVAAGATPEHSYSNLINWIFATVTGLRLYNPLVNDVAPGSVPPNPPPNPPANPLPVHNIHVQHPLVYQKVSHQLQTAILMALDQGNWGLDCHNAGVSCGAMVLALKPTPSSSYITTALMPVGPFRAYGGM